MKTEKKAVAILCVTLFFTSMLIQSPAFAMAPKPPAPTDSEEITIQEFTGTVTITRPDGTVITLSPGEEPPPIPSGSTIEATTGTVRIQALCTVVDLEAGSSVQILIDEETKKVTISTVKGKAIIGGVTRRVAAIVESGEAIVVRCPECSITVIRGRIDTYYEGKKKTLEQGGTFHIKLPPPEEEPLEPEPIEASPYLPD